jgi:signal transduction histidine kinase/CheY-like chemotaxis protein
MRGEARLLDYVHPEDRERKLALMKQSMDSMAPLTVESERFIAPGGKTRWWQVHATVRRLPKGSAQFDGIALDITGRRAAEEQLRKAQRLDALGQLTGGIAHDFNNLLGVILGDLDLALEKSLGNRELETLIRGAVDSARHGAELTKRLLAFSRGHPVATQVTDLNQLLPRVAKMLRRTLGGQIALKLRLGDDLWACLIDPAQFEDIVLNLALNARDAMLAGGTLTLETDNVYLDAESAARLADASPGDFILFSVNDTGGGMSQEVLEHVFEPLFTTKGPGEGTGLSLSQVYGFVKQSKGHVAIDSELGRGTTVAIYLPRVFASTAPLPDGEARGRQPHFDKTVLVVEDNERLRVTAVAEVRRLGYRVLHAGNAATAMQLLDVHPEIDVLFSDLVMPGGMTGYDLAFEARRRYPTIKVLLTSGRASKARGGSRGQIEGMQFLTKPYGKQDLAAKLAHVLDMQRP